MTTRWSRALAFAALAAAGTAHAEAIPQKARSLADRGRIAHDRRDYAGAIAAFTEAYAIAPAPALLFNLAQAYRLRGNCEDALLMYRRYLGANPSDSGRALAESHLTTVERCIQNRTVRVAVDPQLRAIAIPRAPAPPADIVAFKRGPSRTQKVGAGIAITGGAALLAAAYYGLEARDIGSEVERRYAGGESWKKLASLDAQGDRAAGMGKAAAITGIAALVTGATILVIDHRRKATVMVEPTTRGARIGARWRF